MSDDYSPHLVEAHRRIRDLADLLPQRRLNESDAAALAAIHALARVIAVVDRMRDGKAPAIFAEDLEPHTLPSAKFPGQF